MKIFKTKIFKIILFIVVMIFLWTNYLWKFFSHGFAGSYASVEAWDLKIKENDLLEIIKTIQKEHPDLKPPNNSYPSSEKHRYWTKIAFYYKDTNEDVYTWTRPDDNTSYTTFAFVAIATHQDSLTPPEEFKMDRREINSDFGYFENIAQKKKFKNRIVKLIEQKIGKDKVSPH